MNNIDIMGFREKKVDEEIIKIMIEKNYDFEGCTNISDISEMI